MILHTVKVYPSKINFPKRKQLAWKIAEIASDNANFGLPEIDVGLLGGAGHLQRLFPQSVTRMMNFRYTYLNAKPVWRLKTEPSGHPGSIWITWSIHLRKGVGIASTP